MYVASLGCSEAASLEPVALFYGDAIFVMYVHVHVLPIHLKIKNKIII